MCIKNKTDIFFNEIGLIPVDLSIMHEIKYEISACLNTSGAGFRFLSSGINKFFQSSSKIGCQLILDIGGSKLKYEIWNFGYLVKNNEIKFPHLEWNLTDFVDFIFSFVVNEIPKDSKFDSLGIIFSFPGTSINTDFGVDIKPDLSLTKGWKIKSDSEWFIGDVLLKSLKDFMRCQIVYVINDVISVLLNDGSDVGVICGTGVNAGIWYRDQGVNLEAGDFNSLTLLRDVFYKCRICVLSDLKSPNYGRYFTEKMVTIPYMFQQFLSLIDLLKLEDILPSDFKKENIDFKAMDLILSEDIEKISNQFNLSIDYQYPLCKGLGLILDRATSVFASLLSGINFFYNRKSCVSIEGGSYFNTKFFPEKTQEKLKLLKSEVVFKGDGSRLGMKGLADYLASKPL